MTTTLISDIDGPIGRLRITVAGEFVRSPDEPATGTDPRHYRRGLPKSGCVDHPDCFTCPFPDCIWDEDWTKLR